MISFWILNDLHIHTEYVHIYICLCTWHMCSWTDIITITLSRHLARSCCCWWWCIMHTYDFLLSFTCKRIPHRTLFILRIRIFTLRSGAAECWERVNRSRVFSISGTTDLAWFAWSCVTFSKRRAHQNYRSDVMRWTYSRVLFFFPFFTEKKKFSLKKILAWRLNEETKKKGVCRKRKGKWKLFSFLFFFLPLLLMFMDT